MTTDQYLENVLSQQRLTNSELNELRAHRADVQTVLEQRFSESNPDIRYAGSYKKKAMIRDAYDRWSCGDLAMPSEHSRRHRCWPDLE